MKDFQELLEHAKKKGLKKCVVACAEDFPTIEALHHARQENIATGILFGDKMRIEKIADSLKIPISDFETHHYPTESESLKAAIDLSYERILSLISI